MKSHKTPRKKSSTHRTLFLTKIKLDNYSNLKKRIKKLFEDPENYLKLPNECESKFIIGKNIIGPRYDNQNKLIPYTIVGNYDTINIKKRFNSLEKKVNAKEGRRNSLSKQKNKFEDNLNNDYISDKKLEIFFSGRKEIIEKKHKRNYNSFIEKIPKNLNDTVKKHLYLQEKSFHEKNKTDTYRNHLKNRIEKKIKKRNELLFLSSDNYREKKEIEELLDKSKEKSIFGNSIQNWSISLRKPNNFKGIRSGIFNCGSDKKPYWAPYRENLPVEKENIVNPSFDFNEIYNKKSNSVTYIKSIKNKNQYQNFMNKTMNMCSLEVKGRNLLNFENNHYKSLKGSKKIVKFNYDRDSMKDLNFVNNWKYKGFNTLN